MNVRNTKQIVVSKEFVYGKDAEDAASGITLHSAVQDAVSLKSFLNHPWRFLPGDFPGDYQNYVAGWNISENDIGKARIDDALLFLNLDLEDNGCSRRCSHCFTMDGQIDRERGRLQRTAQSASPRRTLTQERLIDQIVKAKQLLGLQAVRILGRGEPTESPYLLDFLEQLAEHGIQSVVFTRGHVLGNDQLCRTIFKRHNISGGEQLAERLFQLNASVITGYSALDDLVHDGMTGIHGHAKESRIGLRRLMDLGFHRCNPTRLGVEAPISRLNMKEMPVSYVLFQCLGISPVYNAYMVTGRSDEEFFLSHTPSLEERLHLHAKIQTFSRMMGICGGVGAYLGTRECHDVEHGLYIPSTGLVRPCPGYEAADSIVGELITDDVTEIWEKHRVVRPQHICQPKIAHGFPLNYGTLVENAITKNRDAFENEFTDIVRGIFV